MPDAFFIYLFIYLFIVLVLSGGSTMFPGFPSRLEKEVTFFTYIFNSRLVEVTSLTLSLYVLLSLVSKYFHAYAC